MEVRYTHIDGKLISIGDHRGHEYVVVRFTTTCAISAYNQKHVSYNTTVDIYTMKNSRHHIVENLRFQSSKNYWFKSYDNIRHFIDSCFLDNDEEHSINLVCVSSQF